MRLQVRSTEVAEATDEYAFKITNKFAVNAVSTHKHQLNISTQVSNGVESVTNGGKDDVNIEMRI